MTGSQIPVISLDQCIIATDLHCNGGAQRSIWFRSLLNRCRELSSSLLLLGDLFDLWCGDEQLEAADYQSEIDLLRHATNSGTSISIIPGNRDFLLGQRFEAATGVKILGDAVEIQWAGERWHCSHGDLLGTEDHGYQRLRRVLRHPLTRSVLTSLPMVLRKGLAGGIRSGSRRSIEKKTKVKMQPDLRVVEGILAQGYDRILCGHFHVSRREKVYCPGKEGVFQVLEPFEERGAYLLLRDRAEQIEWWGC